MTTLKSSKEKALAVLDKTIQGELEPAPKKRGWATRATTILLKALSDADATAAQQRVKKLKLSNPTATPDELAERIIKKKCQQTAAIGAASAGTGLIPGLGTITSLTLGVATDISATFKLQAEMVLELAAAYDFPLAEVDEQRLIFLMTGISTGSNIVLNRVGKDLSIKLTERYAQKWLSAALPFIGVAASSSTNALATMVIGQRAKAFFKDGPEAVSSWQDSLRAITGLDERKLTNWLMESSSSTLQTIGEGVQKTGEAVSKSLQLTGSTLSVGLAKTGHGLSQVGQNIGEGVSKTSNAVLDVGKDVAQTVSDKTEDVVETVGSLFKRKAKEDA